MDYSDRLRNRASNNLRLKASSLYYLNEISNLDSVDNTFKSENWRDLYTFTPKVIGRGHFSKVYKAKCCDNNNTVAIKIIRRKRLGTDKIDDIMREIEIMNTLKNTNSGIIQLLEVHTSLTEVAIVMEFASGGDLFHVTQDSRTGLPEVYVQIVLKKILSVLSLLHRQDIVHLDIKADNILLRKTYPSTDVALSDFGLARKLTKSKVHKEMIGTPDYIAPEVVNYEQICLKSDMWSVGVLAYFMLTNVSPFTGTSKDDTLHRVTKTEFEFVGKLLEENMNLARTFVNKLLVKLPDDRLSADDCLSHEFLANVPIMEYPPDRPCESHVISLDDPVQVRHNTSFKNRGMVISQYDMDSSHMKRDLMDSDDEILDRKEIRRNCDQDEHVSNEMELSVHSIDQGTNVENSEDGKECYLATVELEEMIEQIRSTSHNDKENGGSSDTQEDVEEDSQNIESCSHTDNSVSEMTTSYIEPSSSTSDRKYSDNETETTTSESYSILIRDDNHKENYRPDPDRQENNNNHFQHTQIRDSRRRANGISKSENYPLKPAHLKASFRTSRENIIDNDRDADDYDGDDTRSAMDDGVVENYSTFNSHDSNMDTLRSGISRRHTLTRSLKRDSDKPTTPFKKWRRYSKSISKTTCSDNLVNGPSHNVVTSHPALTTADTEPCQTKHKPKHCILL